MVKEYDQTLNAAVWRVHKWEWFQVWPRTRGLRVMRTCQKRKRNMLSIMLPVIVSPVMEKFLQGWWVRIPSRSTAGHSTWEFTPPNLVRLGPVQTCRKRWLQTRLGVGSKIGHSLGDVLVFVSMVILDWAVAESILGTVLTGNPGGVDHESAGFSTRLRMNQFKGQSNKKSRRPMDFYLWIDVAEKNHWHIFNHIHTPLKFSWVWILAKLMVGI